MGSRGAACPDSIGNSRSKARASPQGGLVLLAPTPHILVGADREARAALPLGPPFRPGAHLIGGNRRKRRASPRRACLSSPAAIFSAMPAGRRVCPRMGPPLFLAHLHFLSAARARKRVRSRAKPGTPRAPLFGGLASAIHPRGSTGRQARASPRRGRAPLKHPDVIGGDA